MKTKKTAIRATLYVIAMFFISKESLRSLIEKRGTVLEQTYLAENICKMAEKLHLPVKAIDKAYYVDQWFALAEEYSHYGDEYYEAEEEEDYWSYLDLDEPISEDCEVFLVEPLEEIEARREQMLRKYDVLYGEDLSEYSFDGPMLDKKRVAELAEKFEAAHRGSDYEDNYARSLSYKLLSFLEWTPRTEFPFGEIEARLDY